MLVLVLLFCPGLSMGSLVIYRRSQGYLQRDMSHKPCRVRINTDIRIRGLRGTLAAPTTRQPPKEARHPDRALALTTRSRSTSTWRDDGRGARCRWR